MLKIGQLAQIKSESPYVYEALTQVVGGVNAVGRATGVDPSGTIAARDDRQPERPGRRRHLRSGHHGQFGGAIAGFFISRNLTRRPSFSQPYVHFLGSSRNLRIAMGNQTLYWRAYSQYLGSDPSAPVTFGSPATAVTGGGTAAGPALQLPPGASRRPEAKADRASGSHRRAVPGRSYCGKRNVEHR
jgi:hypothetical protein